MIAALAERRPGGCGRRPRRALTFAWERPAGGIVPEPLSQRRLEAPGRGMGSGSANVSPSRASHLPSPESGGDGPANWPQFRPARPTHRSGGRPPTSSLPSPGSPARARVQSSAPGCRAIGMFRCTAGRASTRPRTRAGRKPGSTRPRRVGLGPLRDRPRSGRSSRAPCGSRTRIPRSGARRDTKTAGVKVLAQYSSSSTPYVVRAYTTIRLSVMSRMLASG
jgi:hypothetical protein